ncbi:MAG TPA: glycosyltransferase family 4 protein [Gemmatimonadales bacterium]|nr:glycosyltransferase family 4 protein [Gemmatimonadales bacterium]
MERDAPIRVLVVADKLGFPGVRLHGMGRAIVEWTRSFDPARVALHTCVLRDVGGYRADAVAAGEPIEFLDLSPFSLATLAALIRRVRRQDIEVLHLNGLGASTFGRLAGRLTARPAIVHVHSNSYYDPKGYPAYVRAIDNLLAPFTARAVAISETVREFCIDAMGFRPGQVELVHYATPRLGAPPSEARLRELRRRYGLDGCRVIGVSSRLYPIKGHRVVLDAFPAVLARLPDARVLFVGDGPERPVLEAQARSLGVADRVCFAGFQDDMAAYLRLFSVAIVPSLHPEGFGLVAVEALAAGVPVIASRVGGLPEIVTDGVAGFLVEPGNARDLAEAIVRVLGEPGGYAALSAAAVIESQRFSMDRFTDRMEHIYRTLARPARASALSEH